MASALGAARGRLSSVLSQTQKTVKPLFDTAEKEISQRYAKMMEANKQYVVKDEAKAADLAKQWLYTKLDRYAGHCLPCKGPDQGNSMTALDGIQTSLFQPSMSHFKEQLPAQLDPLGSMHAVNQHTGDSARDTPSAEPAHSNVLPWRRQVPSPPQQDGHSAPQADNRIILLFDLNGTLTSHTSQRRSAGVNRMRPGLEHMQRLQVKLSGQGTSMMRPIQMD